MSSQTRSKQAVKPTATLSQLEAQIAALQRQADEIRNTERREVIVRIKGAIDTYGLTHAEIFGKSKKAAAGAPKAKYADEKGNTWVGRGPRPRWLTQALAAGRALEDFAVK